MTRYINVYITRNTLRGEHIANTAVAAALVAGFVRRVLAAEDGGRIVGAVGETGLRPAGVQQPVGRVRARMDGRVVVVLELHVQLERGVGHLTRPEGERRWDRM